MLSDSGSSQIYLLVDPKGIRELDKKPEAINFVDHKEDFCKFVAAVIYVGKGNSNRPFEHFREAAKLKVNFHIIIRFHPILHIERW